MTQTDTITTRTITPAEYIELVRHAYAGDARKILPATVIAWREQHPDWQGQRWAMWLEPGRGTVLGPVNVT